VPREIGVFRKVAVVSASVSELLNDPRPLNLLPMHQLMFKHRMVVRSHREFLHWLSRPFRAPSAKLRVIAFTDPNALLSYRITPLHIGHPEVDVTNVIVSNDCSYFGVLERPDTAHCGYAWNAAVLGAIANEYDGQNPSRSVADVPHNCGI
jgi:hypothetical protein